MQRHLSPRLAAPAPALQGGPGEGSPGLRAPPPSARHITSHARLPPTPPGDLVPPELRCRRGRGPRAHGSQPLEVLLPGALCGCWEYSQKPSPGRRSPWAADVGHASIVTFTWFPFHFVGRPLPGQPSAQRWLRGRGLGTCPDPIWTPRLTADAPVKHTHGHTQCRPLSSRPLTL